MVFNCLARHVFFFRAGCGDEVGGAAAAESPLGVAGALTWIELF